MSLLEAGDYSEPRLGETLPPLARQLLRQLDVLDGFEAFASAGGARQVYGTSILWGSAATVDEPYLHHARGAGWHLDRAAFDAFLADACERRGVRVRRRTRVRGVEAAGGVAGGAWRLKVADGDAAETETPRDGVLCRFVVDATARGLLARRLGARPEVADRLAAYACYFGGEEDDAGLLVEAFEHGWWYAAGLPAGRTVAVCLTDADLGRQLRLHEADGWRAALDATEAIGKRLVPLTVDTGDGGPLVRAAASRVLDPPAEVGERGAGWLAAGDSASTFDPLSSQGIAKALRAGIYAAYAASDHLRGDRRWLTKYRRFVADEYRGYLETRAQVYADETRWPTSPFWRRRSAQ